MSHSNVCLQLQTYYHHHTNKYKFNVCCSLWEHWFHHSFSRFLFYHHPRMSLTFDYHNGNLSQRQCCRAGYQLYGFGQMSGRLWCGLYSGLLRWLSLFDLWRMLLTRPILGMCRFWGFIVCRFSTAALCLLSFQWRCTSHRVRNQQTWS